MVLRKLDLLKEAVEVFVEAIHALPLHWGAWQELSNLVTNIEMVKSQRLKARAFAPPQAKGGATKKKKNPSSGPLLAQVSVVG